MPVLEEAGVEVVAVSPDRPAEIRAGQNRHGLKSTMLADPALIVIDLFGVKNQNFNNFKKPGRPGLPVPTSLLIDTNGKVVWKDQSEHYPQRSDPEIVAAALRSSFT
jgi:peroxiredoxin